MSAPQRTYVRRINGRPVTVTNGRAAPLRVHEAHIRALAAAGFGDNEIGTMLPTVLTDKQVQGIRVRAVPPIPAGRRAGRPRKAAR